MYKQRIFAIILLSITLATTYGKAEIGEETKREIKLRSKIEKLDQELVISRMELAEEQFRRGVDTTTKREAEPIVEEIVETPKEHEPVVLPVVVPPVDPTISFTPLQIDSLLNEWGERESQENFENFFERYINVNNEAELCAIEEAKGDKKREKSATDSLYIKRLKQLASPIELPYNYIVREYIDRYTSIRSTLMSNVLSRSQYYFPTIEEELIKADLPAELRSMAVVESALVADASSRAGAKGLWQFMPSTGKMYGLEINYLVDERCDPIKSTIAACKFLKDLHRMFDDWTLALAAYNCGPGNVNKALSRSGLKNGTFWDIYYYLPRETRGYVPAFIGASYGYAFHQQHNIEPVAQPLPVATDTVMINRILHIGQVAQTIDLPIEVIRKLNPQYRRDIIPATTKSYPLRLPQRYISKYIQNEESIHAKDSLFLKQYINPANIEKLRNTPSGTIHRVKSGETIGGIARKYGTSTRQIMVWNHLRNANKISIGQRLRVR